MYCNKIAQGRQRMSGHCFLKHACYMRGGAEVGMGSRCHDCELPFLVLSMIPSLVLMSNCK